jgi:hypothetical protein
MYGGHQQSISHPPLRPTGAVQDDVRAMGEARAANGTPLLDSSKQSKYSGFSRVIEARGRAEMFQGAAMWLQSGPLSKVQTIL